MYTDAPEEAVGRGQAFPVSAQRKVPVWALALAARVICAVVGVCWAQVFCFFGMSRPAVEHNGYTCFHLPGLNWRPDAPKKEDAIFAILAARMAFSSLEIRSRLRYGVSAFKSVR